MTKLAATAGSPTLSQIGFLAGILKKSGWNPAAVLKIIFQVLHFYVIMVSLVSLLMFFFVSLFFSLFVCFFATFLVSGLECFCKLKQIVEI